jgi:hypothetical protein
MATVNIEATTTGLEPNVLITDLGNLLLSHPITANLTDLFDESVLADSGDLQSAVASGFLTLADQLGRPITDLSTIQFEVSSSSSSVGSRAIPVYSDTSGRTIEDTNISVTPTGDLNIEDNGFILLNGTRFRIGDLDDVTISSPEQNQVLEYVNGNWVNTRPRLTWLWTPAISSNNVNSSRFFNGVNPGRTSNFLPYYTPTRCSVTSLILFGEILGQPYTFVIYRNGSIFASYQRLGTSLSTVINNPGIVFEAGDAVYFRCVTSTRVNFPTALVHLREIL